MSRLGAGTILLLTLTLATPDAPAQSTKPVPNLIQRSTTAATQPRAGANGDSSILRVALSLGAVLGLIVLMYWGTRKLAPRSGLASTTGAIRVLARTPISARHRVSAILVGRRIVIVAEGPQQVSTLCEITDPDEVAGLLGQLQGEGKSSLSAVIGAASLSSPSAAPDPELLSTREELAGLMERVRGLASQVGRDRA